MKSSLALRLFLFASASTAVALVATALVLNVLFRDYFEDRVHDELEFHLLQLTGNVGFEPSGELQIAPISDVRFEQALSGFYWLIEVDGEEPLLSPSFWAAPLELPRPAASGSIFFQDVNMGTREVVATASWVVMLGEGADAQEVLLAVAIDRADIDDSISGFTTNSTRWLVILGVFLMAGSWLTTHMGLRPLEKVRADVSGVSHSRQTRLSRDYPSEVLPLINEVNSLLDQSHQTLDRARTSAGNLAHGLKTPLTILRGVSRELERSGSPTIAADLALEIDNMQHIVERELARNRDSQQTRTHALVAPIIDRLTGALHRQPGAEDIRWIVDLPTTLAAPFDTFDLTELLGNLLDNAVKWTHEVIIIRGGVTEGTAFLAVSDDGPGVPHDQLETVLSRGKQLDPSRPGSGLGLAIAQDMAEAHGCFLSLRAAAGGGLKVCLEWAIATK